MEGPPQPPPLFDDDDKPDNPPVVSPHKTTTTATTPFGYINKDPSVSPNAAISLPPPPGRDLDTYVVQFPREQIYRVPPPENAKFVQQYQSPVNRERSGCCKRLFWCFLVLIILGVIAAAIVVFLNLSFNPTAPTFSVKTLDMISTKQAKPAKSGKSTKSAKPEKSTLKTLEIGLRANNPNSKMGIKYKESSANAVSISFKNKNIGNGKFPLLSQDAKGSDMIDLNLQASKNAAAAVPKAKSPEAFTLEFDVDTEFAGAMGLKKKKTVTVTCDIKAKGLGGERMKILSESCDSEFKN